MNRPVIFASVGTDHHPFDRLVDWLDDLATDHGSRVRVVVQHGHSKAPSVAEGHDYLSYDKLTALMDEADVIVSHGGPGTIMDARRSGHVPICVGRDPELGEHVDGHQLRFLAKVAETGAIHRAGTHEEFVTLVDQVLAERTPQVLATAAGAPASASPSSTTRHIPTQRQASGIPVLARDLDGMLEHRETRRPGRIRTIRDYLRAKQPS